MTSTCATPTAARSNRACSRNQLGHAPDGVAELSGWRARRRRRDPRRRRPGHRVPTGVPRRRRRGAQPCLGRPRTLLRAPGDPRRPARHRLRAAGRRGNRQHLRGAARGPDSRCWNTSSSIPAARPATAACSPGRSFPTCAATTAPRACASRSKPSRPYRRSRPPCPASRWRRRASRYRRRRSPAAWRPWAATRSRPPRARAGRCWAPTCAAPVPPSSFPAPSTPTKPPAGRALRAAQALAASGKGHFALIAAENPDGYALFARLREQHPRHMLHACAQRAGRRHRLPRARAVLRARRPPPGARHQRGPAAHQPARLSRP